MSSKNVLLIDCEDRVGLIFDITKILMENHCNIISNGEFVDHLSNHFFMRTEFDGSFDSGKIVDTLKKQLPEKANIRLTGLSKKNIVILATRESHCLGDILARHAFNELNANIQAVISNHEVLKDYTEKHDIPFHYVSHENLSREEHEGKVLSVLDQYNPEYIVLAKYMRILTSDFTNKYKNKIINIHHSFLPAFIGASPYKQAFNRGVKLIGATAHFVNQDLDEGPIISQDTINVDHTHSAKDMSQSGKDVEKIVLSNALKLVLDEKVLVNGNKTVIFD